uniref:Uncharacterized protein n=1 Tax=Arundo donax TaxID=35708 RepID=A0A0A9LVU8_ARUDO
MGASCLSDTRLLAGHCRPTASPWAPPPCRPTGPHPASARSQPTAAARRRCTAAALAARRRRAREHHLPLARAPQPLTREFAARRERVRKKDDDRH